MFYVFAYLDLTEHNANHIIQLYCHLPVSYRSLVDRCGSIGSCKPQILLFFKFKATGKWPLGRSRSRWEDIIRMDLEEIGIIAGNWVRSAQDRDYWRALVNAALNLRVS